MDKVVLAECWQSSLQTAELLFVLIKLVLYVNFILRSLPQLHPHTHTHTHTEHTHTHPHTHTPAKFPLQPTLPQAWKP